MDTELFGEIIKNDIVNQILEGIDNDIFSIRDIVSWEKLQKIESRLSIEPIYFERLRSWKKSLDPNLWKEFKKEYYQAYLALVSGYSAAFEIMLEKKLIFALDDISIMFTELSSNDSKINRIIKRLGAETIQLMNFPFSTSISLLDVKLENVDIDVLSEFCYLRCGQLISPKTDIKTKMHLKEMNDIRHKYNRDRRIIVIELYKNGEFKSQADAARKIGDEVGLTPRVVDRHIREFKKSMEK